MYLHVQTEWPCIIPGQGQYPCEGSLVVISDGDSHSIFCNKCNLGTFGRGQLPEFWMNKLIQNGYIKQLSRKAATPEDLFKFFATRINYKTPNELSGDLLDNFEVFIK